jgi:predicted AAA+ superfamily ATPase
MEFSTKKITKQTIEKLEERLLFGGYPELMQSDWEEKKSIYLK